MPNRCILCKNNSENVDHMFINCPFINSIWSLLLSFFNLSWCFPSWCFPSNILELFVQWKFGMVVKESKTLWIWALPHVCWGVWKEQNNCIFKDKESNAKVVFHKCLNALLENYTHTKGPIPPLNTMVKEKREGCSQSFPPTGWLKENFDGVAKGNPAKVGAGGIITKCAWERDCFFHCSPRDSN